MRTTGRCRRTSEAKSAWAGPASRKATTRTRRPPRPSSTWTNDGVRWLHTGDLGYLDEEGNLYITGRKKYLIILPGGKNVNPERVESALSEARFVKEILVVPSRREDSNGLMEESVRVLVQPAWEILESHTGRSRRDLLAEPQLVKNLIWESIRDCQQRNKHLSHFEKIAAHNIEIHPGRVPQDLHRQDQARALHQPGAPGGQAHPDRGVRGLPRRPKAGAWRDGRLSEVFCYLLFTVCDLLLTLDARNKS